jgi:predicted GNAT superfamily acetyltransferase
MNDPRGIIAGILAALALIAGTILAALERDPAQIALVYGLAGTFGAYAMGLYSEPRA